MSPPVRALVRFWWLLGLGLLLAGLAATAMLYKIDPALPPKLEQRTSPMYSTSARLLLTSADVPYLRTKLTRPAEIATGAAGPNSPAAAAAAVEERPDLAILVRAANLYPLLIVSDQVATLRTDMFGKLPGTVSAQGIFSIVNANRFEPTTLPVIEIFSLAPTPAGAVALAEGTVAAFSRYIRNQQNRAKLEPGERILLQPIQRPSEIVAIGGPSLGLPILAAFALLAAFAALAVLLDRVFPAKRSQAGAPVELLEQRVSVSDTA